MNVTDPSPPLASANESKPLSKEGLSLLRVLTISQGPQWFIGISAFIYFSGYAVDNFYTAYFVINHLGEDVIRLRYLHLGVEFVMLTIICCAFICFGIFGFCRTFEGIKERGKVSNLSSAIYYFVWPSSIFSIIVFTPQEYFTSDKKCLLEDVFCWSSDQILWRRACAVVIIALPLLYMLFAHFPRLSSWKVGKYRFISFLFPLISIITIIFDFFILQPLLKGGEFVIPTVAFLACCLLLSSILSRAYLYAEGRICKENSNKYLDISTIFLFSSFIFMAIFILIVSYVNGVLINIPNIKGGADFTHATPFNIHFKSKIYENKDHIDGVLSIYETSTTLYLARIKPGNDPCDWKTLSKKPSIIEVSRPEISYIELLPVRRPSVQLTCCIDPRKKQPKNLDHFIERPDVCTRATLADNIHSPVTLRVRRNRTSHR